MKEKVCIHCKSKVHNLAQKCIVCFSDLNVHDEQINIVINQVFIKNNKRSFWLKTILIFVLFSGVASGLYEYLNPTETLSMNDLKGIEMNKLGDEMKSGSLVYRILNISSVSVKSYVVFECEITNKSSKKVAVDASMFKIMLFDQTLVETDVEQTITLNDNDELFLNELKPNEVINAKFAFLADDIQEPFIIRLNHDMTGVKHHLFKLNEWKVQDAN
jgi:hypothetical protein